MNKEFEKILERLEDTKDIAHDDSVAEVVSTKIWNKAINRAKQIVQEVAEESQILEDMERSSDSLEDVLNELRKNDGNGWIPCSKRLPGGAINVFATLVSKTGAYTDVLFYYENQWMYERTNSPVTVAKVIAWRPTPEPYKESE